MCFVQGIVPHPPPKATAKLSPEHLGSVGQNELTMGLGSIQSKPQRHHHPAGNPCCSTHPGTTAKLSHPSGHAGSCAPVPPASHPVLQCQCCQEGQQEPSAQGTNTQQIALWRKQWVSPTGCAQWQECKLSRGILTLSPSAPLYIYIN